MMTDLGIPINELIDVVVVAANVNQKLPENGERKTKQKPNRIRNNGTWQIQIGSKGWASGVVCERSASLKKTSQLSLNTSSTPNNVTFVAQTRPVVVADGGSTTYMVPI